MRWDLFCRVIDNHGDLGVCWRLACALAARGEIVRLWVDDATALAWMAPGGAAGVQVGAFDAAAEPGDVVVEAFGCEPPADFLAAMQAVRPVWIDLEYLSAEPYVERSHGLPSPQSSGPAAGLTRWFFFPGFTGRTGGLLHEPGLATRRQGLDRDAWLAAHGAARRDGERVIALFCYGNPALPALIAALQDRPTLLLATPGFATAQVRALLGSTLTHGTLRAVALPHVPQPAFDELLWSADLNCVRGEDSLVRALWAGRPFLWQAYPQSDGAHAAKVEALLDRAFAAQPSPAEPAVRALMRGWNGLAPFPPDLAALPAWGEALRAWAAALARQDDLVTQLVRFAEAKR
jgi:uncharacterized repeat protein (TIGR03837 family)